MNRPPAQTYVGTEEDYYGGMTPTGTLVRDAQVFGFIAETETCVGWNYGRLEELYDKVTVAWHPYGHLVSRLPAELRERHDRIFSAAIGRAQAQGWAPDMGEDEA